MRLSPSFRASLVATLLIVWGLPGLPEVAAAQDHHRVALVGDLAPDTGGATYQSLGTPVLGETGHLAFLATLTGGTSAQGIFAVPEPSFLVGLGPGVVALTAMNRRRLSRMERT